ncbi:ABC transporter permease [Cryptosporangium japonicum]|uniref:Autoinducer 2 import system permease protein LsrC n=1 Tax=Cryptosporangium japonicum TaxID=80872 RepID=A0ABN0UVI7_9ACTN
MSEPVVERQRSAAALLGRLARARELGLVVALFLLFGVTAIVNPRFIGVQSFKDILLNTAIVGLLAVGQTLVVVTRNIDLSVGSVLGLSAFVTGLLFADHDVPIVVAFVVGTLIGAVCGVINGVLVAVCRIPALVVTLGTMYVFRGADYWLAEGRQVNAADMPSAFLKIGSGSVLGIPILPLIALVLLALAAWGMRNLRSGRELYAIGSNPDAARLAGIPVGRRLFVAFVLTGTLSGVAGVLWAARYGTVDATAATGFELNVVAAVVVGGVAIFGGSGTVVGAALGALLLSTIGSALVVLKVEALWERAIDGALLLLAITLDRVLALRAERALRASASRGATTLPANGAAAPPATGAAAVPADGATTTPPDGATTTPPDGATTTPPDGATTTPAARTAADARASEDAAADVAKGGTR